MEKERDIDSLGRYKKKRSESYLKLEIHWERKREGERESEKNRDE